MKGSSRIKQLKKINGCPSISIYPTKSINTGVVLLGETDSCLIGLNLLSTELCDPARSGLIKPSRSHM